MPTSSPGCRRNAVLHRERYGADAADAHIAGYEGRLAEYNARFGMSGNWTDRLLARLAGPQSMSGRAGLRRVLERRGFPPR